MSAPAIRVEHISKKYELKRQATGGSDSLVGAFAGGVRNLIAGGNKMTSEEFWALKDICFDIQQGDRVGIIGRNGAGKSTLLKILSRITKPSSGQFTYYGRMASLLEVGTGFHGDLSGRENIYLNGTILGMSKREIDAKFDEIVAFSEVEKFLDTPVKRYSSGMYVRLAFAVAAHLEPDILIVDEVLAVGDSAFQKKCLGKMKDVSGHGRTILFVSHNMAAIQNLCDKCIYLKNGQLVSYGKTQEVIPEYMRAAQDIQLIDLAARSDRSGNQQLKFTSVQVKDRQGDLVLAAHSGDFVNFDIGFELYADLSNVVISMGIDDEHGQRVTQLSNEVTNQVFSQLKKGKCSARIAVPRFPLKAGAYTFTLFSTSNSEITDWIQEAGSFEVETGDFFQTGKIPPDGQGSVFVDHSFQIV